MESLNAAHHLIVQHPEVRQKHSYENSEQQRFSPDRLFGFDLFSFEEIIKPFGFAIDSLPSQVDVALDERAQQEVVEGQESKGEQSEGEVVKRRVVIVEHVFLGVAFEVVFELLRHINYTLI